ncbi:MAG: zf-HC2 domain-containing protein [Armatimonadota bacterium]|nr:zf-HC2 domain-containing protein [Armatimonadota bacterium]MDR7447668.1 zf-HC2 domain-containing protein [Armatimonadota bacterium]MDR7459003.1 zf-HC2 domain-containing protein [Armatimonadota bacterium]MDR7480104.1 zf-HC2 domain-containing protein [Armatimonadota bacterium]MDR7489557.1 zf-HC2 domain-containing protein [Armatimonadota bacterium]
MTDGHPGDRLTAYLDGTLPSEEATGVAAHLAACRACHGVLEDLTAVRRLLRALPDPEPPPWVLPKVLARIAARRRRRTRLRWMVAAACAGALLALALNLPVDRGAERTLPGAHFRQHAEASMLHPLADITLAGYLTDAWPYEPLHGLRGERP